MVDFVLGHYAYWFTIILLAIGLYGMLIKDNLVKKTIGLSIFQTGVILFFVSIASKWGATVPVKSDEFPVTEVANYMNPLPHTLMLTAIVVGVATLGVAFALLITIYNRYETLNEQELLEKIQ
ncbi:multisubunit sodium/proton antiporter, MrpC subunit [Fodinibius roseus]|uniref:Multisubunit sodium/proton antiporter, MrpC subunit n=1 Tax=Fodinibius roseus TaxID=1194090 RepID=A0A1M5BBR3_9BACT|nr:cation:proton antiporter subunit C [Fodinibius roseus]SHF39890.1 multisubunit sodium/proton antiporter, MrpC subunit [Fodinibius roseus]